MREFIEEQEDGVIDLGAASEVTLGQYEEDKVEGIDLEDRRPLG